MKYHLYYIIIKFCKTSLLLLIAKPTMSIIFSNVSDQSLFTKHSSMSWS